jgi:nucleotide-binding universal stress UspA family protein
MSSQRDGIVAAYDGSPGSEQALRWAAGEARAHGCGVTVCLAWAPQCLSVLGDSAVLDLARQRGEEILASGVGYAETMLGQERVTSLPARGPAAQVLCERSATAEVTVLGTRGHGGVAGLALGSVAAQVAGHARGPVVIVRGGPRPNNSPRPVVLGADGSPASDAAIRFAFRAAEARRIPLLAVCALADAPGVLGGARAMEEDFSSALSAHEKEFPEVTVMRQVSVRCPRAELLDEAAGAPLLVVGARGRGGFEGMNLGSVARALLHHAPCPVAIVRGH